MVDKIDFFNEQAEKLFKILIDSYNYNLEEIKIFHLNDMKWSTKLIYVNPKLNLKIQISQAPYYTDYGFSFCIYKLDTKEKNILYNVPHEKQDGKNEFLINACKDIFSNSETLDLISGKNWKN